MSVLDAKAELVGGRRLAGDTERRDALRDLLMVACDALHAMYLREDRAQVGLLGRMAPVTWRVDGHW